MLSFYMIFKKLLLSGKGASWYRILDIIIYCFGIQALKKWPFLLLLFTEGGAIVLQSLFLIFKKKKDFIYLFEREREHEHRVEEQREREKQTPH